MKKLIFAIKENRYFIGTIIGVIVPFFWFLNFKISQNLLVNILFFIIYFIVNSWYLSLIVKKYLKTKFSFVLSIVLLFYFISFCLSLPIVFYKVSPVYLFIILAIISVVLSLRHKFVFSPSLKKDIVANSNSKKKVIPLWWKISFSLLFLVSIFLLIRSRTSLSIRSPWQAIHPLYIYCYLGLILLTLYLIKLKPKFKVFILVVILLSLLAHSYLIFPYEAGFGGDKWRHLGAEKWLMEGKPYLPVLFGEDVSFKEIGPFKIPEVFLVGNKTSYSNLWAGTISLSWLFQVDVFWIDIFLGFILSSVFLPFILYELGRKLFKKKETIYFLLLMPLCFFPFQMYGSITVPIFFGFLPFCFALLFLLAHLKENLSLKYFLLILILPCFFLYFNYVLYLVLYLVCFLLAIFIYYFPKFLNRFFLVFGGLILIFIVAFLFPSLDILSGYSSLKFEHSIPLAIKDFGNRLLSSRPIFPRPGGLEQDNWLYSGLEENISSSAFGGIVRWNYLLTPIFLLIVFIGLLASSFWQEKKDRLLIFYLLIVVLIAEFIGSYFLQGSQLFTKRLVLANSFFLFFPLAIGLNWIIEKRKSLFLMVIIFLAFLSTTVYISGPKFQTVTGDELKASIYIFDNLKSKKGPYCVLANTWPLLALEGVSGRQIIAGGFPVYEEYAQPERVQLFNNLNRYPHINDFNKALEITGAEDCYFMTEDLWIVPGRKKEVFESLEKLAGQPLIIGDVYLWHYSKGGLSPEVDR